MEGAFQEKGEHVKVTVRVRPLPERDQVDGRRPVLHTTKQTATLHSPSLVEGRAFTFDRCFWSADPAVREARREHYAGPCQPMTPVPRRTRTLLPRKQCSKKLGVVWRVRGGRNIPRSAARAGTTGPG